MAREEKKLEVHVIEVINQMKEKLARNRRRKLGFAHCWSDGCRSQFKNRNFFSFSTCTESVCGIKFECLFFCSCHGKGGSDAETAFVHATFRRLQKVKRLNSSRELHDRMTDSIAKLKKQGRKKRQKKHTLVDRVLIYIDAAELDQAKWVRAASGSSGAVAGSNDLYRFGGSSGTDGELSVTWLACRDACQQCMVLDFGNCSSARKATSNFRNNKKQHGATEPKQYVVSLVNPWAAEEPDEAEERLNNERKNAARAERKARRVVRGWMGRVKRGFRFCWASGGGGVHYCEVKSFERDTGLATFVKFHEVEDQLGIWKLGDCDFVCSVGEFLEPFNFNFAVVDANEKTFSIPAHVQSKFNATIAALRQSAAEEDSDSEADMEADEKAEIAGRSAAAQGNSAWAIFDNTGLKICGNCKQVAMPKEFWNCAVRAYFFALFLFIFVFCVPKSDKQIRLMVRANKTTGVRNSIMQVL
jgi:hypothetical protein